MELSTLTSCAAYNPATHKRIEDMSIGQGGHISPFGMVIDLNNQHLLCADYSVHGRQDESYTLYIERRRDGFHVWPYHSILQGHRWEKRISHGRCVPITKIHHEEP